MSGGEWNPEFCLFVFVRREIKLILYLIPFFTRFGSGKKSGKRAVDATVAAIVQFFTKVRLFILKPKVYR